MNSCVSGVFDSIFVECFGDLEDKRYKNKRPRFMDIIAICVYATLAGMTDITDKFCTWSIKYMLKYSIKLRVKDNSINIYEKL